MSSYCVVEFSDEPGKPIEAVPACWLLGEDKVKWPISPKVATLIKKCNIPTEHPNIEWKVLKCRILHHADDCREARKAAKKLTITSDVEVTDTEALLNPENRKLRSKNVKKGSTPASTVDDELPAVSLDNGENNEVLAIVTTENPATIFTIEVPATSTAIPTVRAADPILPSDSMTNFVSEFRNFQEIVLEKLLKITKELDHVSQVVGRLGISSVQHEGLELPESIELPLRDSRQLATLQRWLEKKSNQKKLVTYMRGIGGSDWKDCGRRILDRLLSTDLGRGINLSGANGKISFRSHLLRTCLISSLRSAESPDIPTEKEVDDYVVRYFGGAKDRDGGRAARQKNKSSSALTQQASTDQD